MVDKNAYFAELKEYGAGVEWQEASCEVNGVNIAYYHTTPATSLPTLVFLHGRGCCGAYCLPYLAPMASRFQVYLPDARGYGKSDRCPPGSFTMANLIEDAAAFIKHVSPEHPVCLIGHSLGAAVAARVAKNYPELILALVLEDPPWRQLPGHPAPFDGLPPGGGPIGVAKRMQQLSEEEFLKADEEAAGNLLPKPYRSSAWVARTMDAAAVEHAFTEGHIEVKISEAVEGLNMPVLITRASHMVSEIAKKVLESYPKGVEVYFPGDGLHTIHEPPNGKKWQEEVLKFLETASQS